MGLRPGVAKYHTDDKKLAELHCRVSQETFDSAVQENIDDFDMAPDEAVADAVQQFESQGVNLSNIVQRVPGADAADDPPAVVALRQMKAALEAAAESEDAEEEVLELEYGSGKMKMSFMKVEAEGAVALTEAAAAMRAATQADRDTLTLITLNGAVDALVSTALAVMSTPSALPPVLECLAVVLSDAEGREQLGQRGIAALTSVMSASPFSMPVATSLTVPWLAHEPQPMAHAANSPTLALREA